MHGPLPQERHVRACARPQAPSHSPEWSLTYNPLFRRLPVNSILTSESKTSIMKMVVGLAGRDWAHELREMFRGKGLGPPVASSTDKVAQLLPWWHGLSSQPMSLAAGLVWTRARASSLWRPHAPSAKPLGQRKMLGGRPVSNPT